MKHQHESTVDDVGVCLKKLPSKKALGAGSLTYKWIKNNIKILHQFRLSFLTSAYASNEYRMNINLALSYKFLNAVVI